MIWERCAYNLLASGMLLGDVRRKLREIYGVNYSYEDIDYAVELCSFGPVPGYEAEEEPWRV